MEEYVDGYETFSDRTSIKQEKSAVAKGAKLLDKILPGWYKQVDLSKLDMGDASLCMMGQLFGAGVEAELAEEMYPGELEKARKSAFRYMYSPNYDMGYCTAFPGTGSGGVVSRIMRKLGLAKAPSQDPQYKALAKVCMGHDNSCIWAEEIAKRMEKDEEAKSSD